MESKTSASEEPIRINFSELRHQSKIAAFLTAVSSLIVIGSLFLGYRQTVKATKELSSIRQAIIQEKKEKNLLESDIRALQAQKNAYSSILNSVVSRSGQTSEALRSAINSEPSAAISIPRIYVQASGEDDRISADKAAVQLRAAGYIVPAIQIMGPAKSPRSSQLRYFYDDQLAHSDLVKIWQVLHSAGIAVEIVLIPSAKRSPPRQYELWFANSAFGNTALQKQISTLADELQAKDQFYAGLLGYYVGPTTHYGDPMPPDSLFFEPGQDDPERIQWYKDHCQAQLAVIRPAVQAKLRMSASQIANDNKEFENLTKAILTPWPRDLESFNYQNESDRQRFIIENTGKFRPLYQYLMNLNKQLQGSAS